MNVLHGACALALLAAACLGWSQDVAAQSEAELPAVRLDVFEPVSPDEADAYFQALGQARMAAQPALEGPAAVTSGLDGLIAAQTVPGETFA